MSTVGDPGQRVGDADRQAAITALGEHWRAGRLDPAEHERRTTAAYSAVTRADLEALFADLPGGLPATVAGVPAPTSAAPGSAPAPVAGQEQRPLVPAESWLGRHRDALMGVTPFVALVLFFTTKTWLWFLLIPAAGAFLYTGNDRRDRRERRRGDD